MTEQSVSVFDCGTPDAPRLIGSFGIYDDGRARLRQFSSSISGDPFCPFLSCSGVAALAMTVRVFVDTIQTGEEITSKRGWHLRRPWWEKLPMFDSFEALESARETQHISLAVLRPKHLVKLEILPANSPEWTEEEMAKLVQQQSQGDLFSPDEQRKQLRLLEKLPFDFYYHYLCDTPKGEQICKHKIVDWEVGMLYRTCRKDYGQNWEVPFRAKLEEDFGKKDLIFMMGNIHRFQHQWLIISLLYPPKPEGFADLQPSLF